LKPPLAFFAAAVFTFSGYMVGHLRHVPVITAVAMMPWMFLTVEHLISEGGYFRSLILASLTSFCIFAGHLSTSYEIILFLVIYFLLRLAKKFQSDKKESIIPVALFFFGIFSGVLLSGVQILPSAELVGYSGRGNMVANQTVDPGYKWNYLSMFLNPYIMGDPSRGTWFVTKQGNFWENVGYLGIIPLILLLYGLFVKFDDKKIITPLKICFIIAFILMLGNLTPVYGTLMKFVPGFSITRISGRFVLFVDFFGAVLAAFAMENFFLKFKEKKRRIISMLLILISITDLFYFGFSFNTVMPLSYFDDTESVKFLKNDNDFFRIKSITGNSWVNAWNASGGWRGNLDPYMDQRELLPPDFNLHFRLPSPSIVYEMTGHFSVKNAGDFDAFTSMLFGNVDKQDPTLAGILGAENVKYVVSPENIGETAGLSLVKEYPAPNKNLNIYLYKNNRYLPRAYFAGQSVVFDNRTDVLIFMSSRDFNPPENVVIEGPAPEITSPGRGSVRIVNYQDSLVEIDTNTENMGYLVLSDTWYPGWHAYIDGTETQIFKANYNFRAVVLAPGKHKVVFEFKPESFRIGEWVSIGGAILLGIGFPVSLYPRVRRRFSR
jgi:hypothetical protein